MQPVTLAVRTELLGRGRHHVEVRVEDDAELARSFGRDVEEGTRLAARLEPLDGEAGPDEADREIEAWIKSQRNAA